MRRAVVLGCLLVASGTFADLPPPQSECRADSECVITPFQGCCSNCGCPGPHAMSRQRLQSEEQRCAVIECAAPRCKAMACPAPEPISALRAVCKAGHCEAERLPPAPECRSDADCRIVYPSQVCPPGPCGCCPGVDPQAVSVDRAIPRPLPQPVQRPRPLTRSGAEPAQAPVRFGLTPGPGTQAPPPHGPPPPNCSPCRAPNFAEAACSSGRCVVVPIRRAPPPG